LESAPDEFRFVFKASLQNRVEGWSKWFNSVKNSIGGQHFRSQWIVKILEASMYRLFRTVTALLVFSLFASIGAALPAVAQETAPPAVAAPADLSGYWDVRTPNPSGDGTYRDTYFEIQQTGETLGGSLIRRPRGIPITGTFKGGAIHVETVPPLKVPVMGMPRGRRIKLPPSVSPVC